MLAVTYGEASTRGSASRMHAFPDPWLIARRDGAAAGVVTANVYGRMAYVAMLAVDPVHRRAGVATALMRTLLDRLEARGVETTLLDATEQAETLYRGLGFVEVDRTRVFAREAPALPATGRRGVESATLERALRLDASIYGCDRSAELRRFVEDPYALVAAEADGYLMARGPVLGPFAAGSSKRPRGCSNRRSRAVRTSNVPSSARKSRCGKPLRSAWIHVRADPGAHGSRRAVPGSPRADLQPGQPRPRLSLERAHDLSARRAELRVFRIGA